MCSIVSVSYCTAHVARCTDRTTYSTVSAIRPEPGLLWEAGCVFI